MKTSTSEQKRKEMMSMLHGELKDKPKHRDCALENYAVHTASQRNALEQVFKIAERIEEFVEKGWNVVFYGKPGTGKDHLMISLLKRASAVGAKCCLMNGQKFLSAVRDNIGKGGDERLLTQKYETASVLGISDVLPERRELGGYNIDMLYLILNTRWERSLSTMVTLNAKGEADIRKRIGGQVADRLFDNALVIHADWDSYRRPLVL